jgi:alkanesulfonate monooxygenase SsuD/methylene tetrahydromethanopterin reductase-like flavin-dependent oxidoreductase (luciferase family)
MRIGVTLFFQNYRDWERYDAGRFEIPAEISDAEIYDQELQLGDLIEPLGFDSLWTVEHHNTPYTMIPDPTQLLAYYAGRTSRVDMGTMVIVPPWHHPLHIAEKIALLDLLLQGRRFTIGLGRGASAKEFEPLRMPMERSRELFLEGLDIIRLGLTRERFSYAGKNFDIPETSIRPRPRSQDLIDRMYCSWGSPQTLPIAANAGLGMLVIPMKPFEAYARDFEDYNAIREINGWPPKPPIVVCWVFCAEDAEEARETARRYMGNYSDSAARHYGFAVADAFKEVRGYEHYQSLAEQQVRILAEIPREELLARFAETQVYGTPNECLDKLRRIHRVTRADEFIAVFSYGGMPIDVAERSMRLFAERVLPAAHALEAEPELVTPAR